MLVLLLALSPMASVQAGPPAPEIGVLISRISQALGGPEGGAGVLDGQEEVEFVFRRTVRDAVTTKELTADHRYVVLDGGARQRLDVRMHEGEGKNSAIVVEADAAWVIADGQLHEAERDAVAGRLAEFAPARLFSVPLALAAEGEQILGDAALSVVGRVDDRGKSRFILVGTDADGTETARLEVDARTYRPLEVAFRSPSGEVVYRYDDYREIAPGLIVPFEREFLRNGIRISRTVVQRLALRVPADPDRFDRETLALPKLRTAANP
jgi:hypothetical protein